jgi:Fe-S cluster biogenesis protein NfuA
MDRVLLFQTGKRNAISLKDLLEDRILIAVIAQDDIACLISSADALGSRLRSLGACSGCNAVLSSVKQI